MHAREPKPRFSSRNRYFPGEIDLVQMHRLGSGSPLERDGERCLQALQALHNADAWGRIEPALAVQTAATPDLAVPDIAVLVMLGDPDDEYFMGPALGMSANGAVTGYICLT